MKYFLLIGLIISLGACGNSDGKTDRAITQAESQTAGAENGEMLFKVNCSQCHQPKKDFVGPSLAGVDKRWKNKALLYDFVRNSTEVIRRDEYAAALYKKWNESPMLPFPELSDEDIAQILTYCDTAE